MVCLVLCLVAGVIAGCEDGMTPSLAAYRVTRLSALMLGFLCLPLMAAAARRDAATGALDAVRSRPQQAHELMLARWLGNLGVMLALLVALTAATFAAQALLSPRVAGDMAPRFSLLAIWHALAVGALPLMVLATLGYCVAQLLQNALATAVIALYWLLVMLGRDYLARIFDFSLAQNAVVYVLLSAGAVLAAMAAVRYRQGLRNARKRNVPLASLSCIVLGTLFAWHYVATRHDPPLHSDQIVLTESGQSILTGRLPGFWLPDQHGRTVRLRDLAGKPLVIGFWSPATPASVGLLSSLEAINDEWSPQGVAVIGVCLANDAGMGARFAHEQGCGFPVVTDDGTHWAEDVKGSSPLAVAYDIGSLPAVFVADTQRNRIATFTTAGPALVSAVGDALRRLPPPQ
jgi:peroxiredoxin